MKNLLGLILLFPILCLAADEKEKDRDREGLRFAGWPFLNYSSDEGWNYGGLLRVFDYGDEGRRPFEALYTATVDISTRGSKVAAGSYERTHFFSNPKLRFRFDAFGAQNDFARYYGVGDNTIRDLTLDAQGFYLYKQKAYGFSPGIRYSLGQGLDLAAGMSARWEELSSNRNTSQFQQDFGLGIIERYTTRIRFGAILERRNSEFIPSEGYYAAAGGIVGPSFLGDLPDSWFRGDLDFRKYHSLIPNRWLWIAAQVRYTGTTSTTPFTDKAKLGSFGTLRGLPLFRFISNHSLSTRAEIRSIVIRSRVFDMPLELGMGIFADNGRIGDNFARLFEGQNHFGWGFSFIGSYFTDDFIGRTDIGFSGDETAVYIGLGHSI